MQEDVKQKYTACLNEKFEALLYIVEYFHDGNEFYFGTGLVTSEFHSWFAEQIQGNEEFTGQVFVEIEDGRVGRAIISRVQPCGEAGSKIVFTFQGGLVRKDKQESPNE